MEPAGQPSAGAVSNQYQILGHLASGGMAELYIARAVGAAGIERHVVLKRIMAEYAGNHRFVSMFLDEARLAAQLHHPNIAQVHDIGRIARSYFFTMEYVHGENVRNLLHRVAGLKRHIPLEHTLAVIMGAAAGLHYAHDKRGLDRRPLGIVHRDVSPANLMVSYDGAIKVVDFGIAKAADRMTETRTGAIKGKVAYMSPEQCIGQPLDRRSDIFSLGIILFEMATMSRLFKQASDFETMNAIVNQPAPAASSRRPDLPRALDAIIARALARRPEDRFATAAEMAAALEAFAVDHGLNLAPSGLGRFLRELFGERPEPWLELEHGDASDVVTVVAHPAVDELPPSVATRTTARQVASEWSVGFDGAVDGDREEPRAYEQAASAPAASAADAIKASRTRTDPNPAPPAPIPGRAPARATDPFDHPTLVVPPRRAGTGSGPELAALDHDSSWRSAGEGALPGDPEASWRPAAEQPAAASVTSERTSRWRWAAVAAVGIIAGGVAFLLVADRDPSAPARSLPAVVPAAIRAPSALAPIGGARLQPVAIDPAPVAIDPAPPVVPSAPAIAPAQPGTPPATPTAAPATRPRPRPAKPPRPPRPKPPARCGDALGLYPPCE